MPRLFPSFLIDALLLAVAAAWGASFLAAKSLTEETGVASALALRFLIAALALAAICALRRERMPRRRGLAVALLLGTSQAAVIGLETWGVSITSATNAGLLISLSLIFTPVLESLAARSWLPRSYFVAATGAVVGVALLLSGGELRAPSLGDVLVVAAAIVRALHVTASARLTRGRADSTPSIVFVQLAVCAVLSSLVAGPDLPLAAARLTATGWANALFLGLVCSVFAFAVQLWAVRRTSATRASMLMGTEPVWALLVGIVIGVEPLGLFGLAGAALIVAATYRGQSIERRHRAQLTDAVIQRRLEHPPRSQQRSTPLIEDRQRPRS